MNRPVILQGNQFPYSSGRLVSLWDMLRFNAQLFVRLMDDIEKCRQIVARAEEEGGDEGRKIKHLRMVMNGVLDDLAAQTDHLQLTSSRGRILRMRDAVYRQASDIARDLRVLYEVVEDELKSCVFMYVPRERAKYFEGDPAPFGQAVADAFPELAYDIAEAGLCIGSGRYTASVYHLMRVMEAGVRRFAKVLKVPASAVSGPNWGDVLAAIDRKIGSMKPKGAKQKARKDALEEVAAYLRHVKNAWRNPAMHPDRKYDQSEAESLIKNVGEFMRELVTLD